MYILSMTKVNRLLQSLKVYTFFTLNIFICHHLVHTLMHTSTHSPFHYLTHIHIHQLTHSITHSLTYSLYRCLPTTWSDKHDRVVLVRFTRYQNTTAMKTGQWSPCSNSRMNKQNRFFNRVDCPNFGHHALTSSF